MTHSPGWPPPKRAKTISRPSAEKPGSVASLASVRRPRPEDLTVSVVCPPGSCSRKKAIRPFRPGNVALAGTTKATGAPSKTSATTTPECFSGLLARQFLGSEKAASAPTRARDRVRVAVTFVSVTRRPKRDIIAGPPDEPGQPPRGDPNPGEAVLQQLPGYRRSLVAARVRRT